jgi:hypothetical protein
MQLAIFFADRLGLALLPPTELAAFRADGVTYRDSGAGFFTATYDRLLDPDGQLAGVLLWCVPESAGLGAALDGLAPRPRPYLLRYVESPPVYGVLFRDHSRLAADALAGGGEQAFGGQRFRGEDGGLAITIDLEYLLEGQPSAAADLAAVQAATAHWVAITELVEARVAEA